MLRTIFWFFVTVVLVIREIVGWRSLGRSIRPAFTLSTVPATSSPAEETAAERRERLRIRARRMMFNEKGVPYAPWMVRRMDEEVSACERAIFLYLLHSELFCNEQELIDLLIQQEDREQRRGKRKPVPRDGQIESNGDLNWKVVNGNVQLTWSTSAEDDTVGYVVEKRAAGVGQYQLVASYDDVSQLKSKGVQGGMYAFVVPFLSLMS